MQTLVCAVGAIAGAVRGAASASSGAELGALAGAFIGPPSVVLGGVAGAVIGALVCGAAGGSAGAALGEIVDENILDNFLCMACEFSFGKKSGEVLESPIMNRSVNHGLYNGIYTDGANHRHPKLYKFNWGSLSHAKYHIPYNAWRLLAR